MKIPDWLSNHLNEKNLVEIRDAVSAAEEKTTGEIVPMVVRCSSPLGHIHGLTFFILISIFEFAYFSFSIQLGFDYALQIQLGLMLIAMLLSFPMAKIEWTQHFLTSKYDRAHNTLVRAELEFHRSRIRSTAAHTGVLLFVSVMERQAVILADEKVINKLGADVWSGVLKILTEGLKARNFTQGFSASISQIGLILKDHFPAKDHANNDLPNELQIKE